MHSTKKLKKKTKKKEKSELTVPEPPAPRYDRAFLAKIFNKNRETNASQGANPVATTIPIQSSTGIQQSKTNVKPQSKCQWNTSVNYSAHNCFIHIKTEVSNNDTKGPLIINRKGCKRNTYSTNSSHVTGS
jgi:hypothetical protein